MVLTNAGRIGVGEMSMGHVTNKAAAALPQSTQSPLFVVSGGRVALLSLIGEVTTAVQAQATTTKVVSSPAIGSDLDLCAAADLSGKGAGTLLSITGTFADGLQAGAATRLPDRGVVIPAGTIDLSAAASSTGAVKWSARWLAIDADATLTAA